MTGKVTPASVIGKKDATENDELDESAALRAEDESALRTREDREDQTWIRRPTLNGVLGERLTSEEYDNDPD